MLDTLAEFKVCMAYEAGGVRYDQPPYHQSDLRASYPCTGRFRVGTPTLRESATTRVVRRCLRECLLDSNRRGGPRLRGALTAGALWWNVRVSCLPRNSRWWKTATLAPTLVALGAHAAMASSATGFVGEVLERIVTPP
jgi:hypothetical protein